MSTQHSGPTLAQRDGLTVIDCRACGWAHLDPLPAIPDGYYESEFWQTKGAGWLAKYEAQRDWLDMRHGDWLSVVEEHVTPGWLLDVGAGWGHFIQAARGKWHTNAIEPSAEAVTYMKNNGFTAVHHGTWENFRDKGRNYNCISALWLMEHLPNPLEFLGWCRAHLASGGVLLLCVPQEWTDRQQRANGVATIKNYWVHPTHLNYWSAATLYGMLGRAGFRVVDALASWPIEQHIINGRDYTANEAAGDEAHRIIRNSELMETRASRLKLARKRAAKAIGRDLVVLCK